MWLNLIRTFKRSRAGTRCPVCGAASRLLDSLDFNKSCEEPRGKYLPPAGVTVDYHLCEDCGFCFAPEFREWSAARFRKEIYNDDYVSVDPDYLDARPRSNAQALRSLMGDRATRIRHLDYGAGGGLLSALLNEGGWRSTPYDPFSAERVSIETLGRFDLVTAFEVFEHAPDVHALAASLSALLEKPGLVLFSTLLTDGHVNPGAPLSWWYAAPRNGHVSLHSRKSLAILGAKHGFDFGSLAENFHAYWKEIPEWAGPLFGRRSP